MKEKFTFQQKTKLLMDYWTIVNKVDRKNRKIK